MLPLVVLVSYGLIIVDDWGIRGTFIMRIIIIEDIVNKSMVQSARSYAHEIFESDIIAIEAQLSTYEDI